MLDILLRDTDEEESDTEQAKWSERVKNVKKFSFTFCPGVANGHTKKKSNAVER